MKRSPRWVVWMAACVFVLLGIAAAPRKSSAIWIGLPGIAPLPYIGDPDEPGRWKLHMPIFYGYGRMTIVTFTIARPTPAKESIRRSPQSIGSRQHKP